MLRWLHNTVLLIWIKILDKYNILNKIQIYEGFHIQDCTYIDIRL